MRPGMTLTERSCTQNAYFGHLFTITPMFGLPSMGGTARDRSSHSVRASCRVRVNRMCAAGSAWSRQLELPGFAFVVVPAGIGAGVSQRGQVSAVDGGAEVVS
jgi:hypothetical protein